MTSTPERTLIPADRLVLAVLDHVRPRTPAEIKRLLPGQTPVDTIRACLGRLADAGLVETATSPKTPGVTAWRLCPVADDDHTLVVFNAVDVPHHVQAAVMDLLAPYDPDIYTRAADASGRAL